MTNKPTQYVFYPSVSITKIFWRSFLDLFRSPFPYLLLLPWAATALAWGGCLWWFYRWFSEPAFPQFVENIFLFLVNWGGVSDALIDHLLFLFKHLSSLLGIIFWILSIFFFLPFFPVFFFFISTLFSPFISPFTMAHLIKKSGSKIEVQPNNFALFKSLALTLKYSIFYLVVLIFSWPILLIPIVGIFWSLFINSYFLSRAFTIDTFYEYTKYKDKAFGHSDFFDLSLLHSGLILAFPIYGLITPVLIPLSFSHLALEKLKLEEFQNNQNT